MYPVHQPRERAAYEAEPAVVHHVFLPRAERVEPVELLGPDVVRAAEIPDLPGLEGSRLKAHKARDGVAHVLVGVFEVYRYRYCVPAVGGDFFGRKHRREELVFDGSPDYRVEGELFKVFRAGLAYAQESRRVHERRGLQKAASVAVEERRGKVRAVDVAFGGRNRAEADKRLAYGLRFGGDVFYGGRGCYGVGGGVDSVGLYELVFARDVEFVIDPQPVRHRIRRRVHERERFLYGNRYFALVRIEEREPHGGHAGVDVVEYERVFGALRLGVVAQLRILYRPSLVREIYADFIVFE